MIENHPLFSICIPAYNRAAVLPELLESILLQDYDNFEIVICEDDSPEREQIRAVAQGFVASHPDRIKYFENTSNLGFDANLRELINRSCGTYCLFMGNDDLLCPGALKTVADVIQRHPRVGVFLRSFAAFEGNSTNIVQIFRYFEREIFFPAGPQSICTFYKRSVVIPGVTLHRETARRFATDRFDGTLLYQIYLVANILVELNGVFSPEIVALYRNGGVPDFGNSPSEKGKFVPQTRTIESSVGFMRGMLDIARYVDESRHVDIYKGILKDLSNYSYPFLAVQAGRQLSDFFKYYLALIKLGFGKQPLFHVYFFSILLLGTARMEKTISFIKRKLGYTPALGSMYRGEAGPKP